MSKFEFSIFQDSVSIYLYNGNEVKDRWSKRQPHYQTLHRVLNLMKDRGFQVGRDPRIEENYKSLTKDHWYGRKGDLEFKASRYPTGWEIEFFQNVVFEKIPAVDIMTLINMKECWHHEQKSMDEFELEDLNGQTDEYFFNNLDRGKKTIFNGQIKYFRDWSGRLSRGIVYHNINNMWWVITNKYELRNIADFELFDPTVQDFRVRRFKKDVKPKEYLLKKEKLKEATSRELVNELKRRGIKKTLTKARGENIGS